MWEEADYRGGRGRGWKFAKHTSTNHKRGFWRPREREWDARYSTGNAVNEQTSVGGGGLPSKEGRGLRVGYGRESVDDQRCGMGNPRGS